MSNVTLHVTIVESADLNRWLWKEKGRYFETPAGAAKAINREAGAIARCNPEAVVTKQLQWVPCTAAGTAATQTLTTTP